METFKITGEYIQLIQFLKAAHLVGTGGEAKIRVDEGEVQVNNEVSYVKRLKLRPGDVVTYADTSITIE